MSMEQLILMLVDVDGAVDMASTLTVAGVVDITEYHRSSDATGDTGALRTEGGASIANEIICWYRFRCRWYC